MTSSRWLGALVAASLSFSAACAPSSEEDVPEANPDHLRTDPNAIVPTVDPSVRLLSSYNAFLDRSTTFPCVAATSDEPPQVGDVRGGFYLRHVKTREELAKELDVDVSASVKMPQASADVGTKVVKTFKQSSTTVTFLVRAFRSYLVSNRAGATLTPEARAMLVEGRTNDFLAKCGGSFVKNIRYEAQVIGILQFEATTEETARTIQTALGVGSPQFLQQVGSAEADIKTKAEQTAAKYNASLSLTVMASGFLSRGRSAEGVVEDSFAKIDELRADMDASFEADLERDRAGYLTNVSRNVRPSAVGQGAYNQLANAPAEPAVYAEIAEQLEHAERFALTVGGVQLRLQHAYEDEVNRFLLDTQNQFRYNISQNAKLRIQELIPIAEEYAGKFRPDRGMLVEPLRSAIERCVAGAGNGDYSKCTYTEDVLADVTRAETELDIYGRDGRIVPMNAWMPRLDTKVSYYNAENECLRVSMRLPRRSEMKLIAPAVTALADPEGEVWFAEDAQCAKPYFANGSGEGRFGCEEGSFEPVPFVRDRHVICVGRSGPAPALPPP